MTYGYYSYMTPISNYVNQGMILIVAAIIAAIVGIVLFFTFLNRKNEGRYTGFWGKLYNLLLINRFYTESMLKLLYVITACVITVTGIVNIVLGSFLMGFAEIIAGNLITRICYELVLMFIILCKKSAAIDRKLSNIENFYGDDFDGEEDVQEETCESFSQCCDGQCCTDDCSSCGEAEDAFQGNGEIFDENGETFEGNEEISDGNE